MKILFLESCEWEYDYIVSDIFENKLEVELFNAQNIFSLMHRKDLIRDNIFCINPAIKLDVVEKVVQFLNPIVIFWFSDEDGRHNNWTKLALYTKFLFRNYNHPSYNYLSNTAQIPLGYVTGFLLDKSVPLYRKIGYVNNGVQSYNAIRPKMVDRKISASFVGQLKSDRHEMCSIFINMKNNMIVPVDNNWNIQKLQFLPADLFKLYSDSIFVLIGRGNISLDCFRIYEAIVAGAIPVIVGDNKEISDTFAYNGYKPKFIQADTWNNAYNICAELLLDKDALQTFQDANITWWNFQIEFIRNKICDLL